MSLFCDILPNRIWGAVYGSQGNIYFIYIDSEHYYCTCPAFFYGRVDSQAGYCKHLKQFQSLLSINYQTQLGATYKMDYPTTYVKQELELINQLFYDPTDPNKCGMPVGTLTNFHGESRRGKSILAIQTGMDTGRKMKKNVLFLSVEGKDGFFQVEPWVKKFNTRFNINYGVEHWKFKTAEYWYDQPKYSKGSNAGRIEKYSYDLEAYWKKFPEIKLSKDAYQGKAISIQVDTLFLLHLLCGFPNEPKISEGGRPNIIPHPSWLLDQYWRTPLADIIRKENIGVLIVDSMSEPMKMFFHGEAQKYPARADAQAMILYPIDKLCTSFDLVGITVHHGTSPPDNKSEMKAYGGGLIQYSHKFDLAFYAGGREKFPTGTLVRHRHPALDRQKSSKIKNLGKGKNQRFKFDEYGIFDLESDTEAVFEEGDETE